MWAQLVAQQGLWLFLSQEPSRQLRPAWGSPKQLILFFLGGPSVCGWLPFSVPVKVHHPDSSLRPLLTILTIPVLPCSSATRPVCFPANGLSEEKGWGWRVEQ